MHTQQGSGLAPNIYRMRKLGIRPVIISDVQEVRDFNKPSFPWWWLNTYGLDSDSSLVPLPEMKVNGADAIIRTLCGVLKGFAERRTTWKDDVVVSALQQLSAIAVRGDENAVRCVAACVRAIVESG